MRHSDAWKRWERNVAKDLGGTRTGPTGLGQPDVINLPVPFAPECKYGAALSLRKADMEQAKRNADGKPWGLFLMQKQTGVKVVVLDYKFFLEMWEVWVEHNRS